MKYEKASVEIVKFINSFIATSGDEPLGNYTCGEYHQGESCNNIQFASGYGCGVYSNGHCESVYCPPGSTGYGCNAWKLVCNHF